MAEPVTRSRRLATTLVVLSLLQIVLIVVQGVTAGHVLTGNRGFVGTHEVVGANVVGFVSIGQIVVVGLLLRRRLVRPWMLVVALLAFGAVVAQVFLGFDGRMALHVPNALLVFAAQFALLEGGRRAGARGAPDTPTMGGSPDSVRDPV